MDPLQTRALELTKGIAPTPKSIEKVSRETGAMLAGWAFTQWRLRERARSKFEQAEDMLFDQDGLEMATHEWLGRNVHASLFPAGARVADLTCGIGSDLIALAQDHAAIGFETNVERAAYTRHNLKIHGVQAEVLTKSCFAEDWDFDFAFADPARRKSGVRTLDPRLFEPSLSELKERMATLKLGVIKLSPLLFDSFLDTLSSDRAFVSLEGECKEVLVFLGSEVASLGLTGVHAWLFPKNVRFSGPSPCIDLCDEPKKFVVEADPAVIRAHLLGVFALSCLGDSNGYLTAEDEPVGHAKSFQVKWTGAFDIDRVKRTLIDLGSKVTAVKCRGVDIEPVKIMQKLKGNRGEPLVLLLYPVGKSIRAVLAEAQK